MKTNAVKKEEVVVSIQAATAKMKMEIHPSAAHFPDLPVMEFLALKADILKNGQLHPIVCLNGKIVDGRQRYRALTELEIELSARV